MRSVLKELRVVGYIVFGILLTTLLISFSLGLCTFPVLTPLLIAIVILTVSSFRFMMLARHKTLISILISSETECKAALICMKKL